MKNIIIVLIISIVTVSTGQADGWKDYNKMIKKNYKDFTPFPIPNSSDGPGTIFSREDNSWHLLYSSSNVMPDLEINSARIPDMLLSNISKTKFSVGINTEDRKILPFDINAIIDKNTVLQFTPGETTIDRLEEGVLLERIRQLDLKIVKNKRIIEYLKMPGVVLIGGVIKSKGLTYKLSRTREMTSEMKADIIQSAARAEMAVDMSSGTNITIKSDAVMYLAYYAVAVDTNELNAMLEDNERYNALADNRSNYLINYSAYLDSTKTVITNPNLFDRSILDRYNSNVNDNALKLYDLNSTIDSLGALKYNVFMKLDTTSFIITTP